MSLKIWPLRPLGDCAKFLSGGTPSKARAEFWEGDIPWVSSGEMTETRIHNTPLRITVEGAEDGSRLVPTNTVLAVVRGMSLAKEFRVAITKREVAFNQDLKAFECKPDVEPEFLFYALFARREHIRELATEASHGTKKLETHTLAAVELPMPKPEIQRRTVEVASAYDELMENNRRRMGLLEEAARLLYREWFVRLRFPGHEHTRLTNGVPQGWERKRVDQLVDIRGGKQIDNELILEEGAYPVFGGNGIQGYTEGFTHDGFVIAFGRVGANCGSIHWAYRGAWINNNASGLVPHSHSEVVLHHLLNFDFSNLRKGAAQPFIPNGVLSTVEFLDAPPRLKCDFCEVVRPMRLQQATLERQNQKLRAARDLLLPRLMSGEIAA